MHSFFTYLNVYLVSDTGLITTLKHVDMLIFRVWVRKGVDSEQFLCHRLFEATFWALKYSELPRFGIWHFRAGSNLALFDIIGIYEKNRTKQGDKTNFCQIGY